jgi:hypothetical protein
MAKKNLEQNIELELSNSTTFNPLINALRENDKKNLFKSNVVTYFHKTGFPLFDYYFGSVINIHDELGAVIRQEPMIGQAAGTFNLVLANSGAGKAQPLSTLIPTPYGVKPMGSINKGDRVFGRNGKPTKVVGVFDQGEKDIYKITFQDNRTAYCCKDHLWNVKIGKSAYKTLSLEEIIDIRNDNPNEYYGIPMLSKPVSYSSKKVPVHPYVLGTMIANNCLDSATLTLMKDDSFIPNKIAELGNFHVIQAGFDPTLFTFHEKDNKIFRIMTVDILKELPELIGIDEASVYIPDIYMYNDINTRMELLKGLMDSLGYILYSNGRYCVRFGAKSEKLMKQVRELIWGLGYSTSKISKAFGNNKAFMMSINIPHIFKKQLFSLPLKLDFAEKAAQSPSTKRYNQLSITNIEYSHKEQARCIKVENSDGLYITEDYIVTHNTTLVVQMAANIIRQYRNSIIIHYDCESRFDISRGENISQLPISDFNNGTYTLKSGLVTLDIMQESIVDLYANKMKMKDELMIKTGRMNEFGEEIEILEPTVIIIDSITSVINESFSVNDSKDMNKLGGLRSNTAGARDAKTLKGFLKDIIPLCKEANIIIYAINHINGNMSMNAFSGPTKQQNFMKQDEAIPGGKVLIFYPYNIIKMIAKTSDDFTEDSDGFNGHMVAFEPVKSSSNQSGNTSKGVSFEMVFSYKDGFDSLRSLILYGKEKGIIEGNKPRMKFKDDPSFTFSFKNIHAEKNEKPIWDNIKKYIMPELETHLSFVEPNVKFDNRQLDY